MESNVMTKMPKILLVSAVLLMLVVCIAPASAGTFTDNNKTYVDVSNYEGARFQLFDETSYYFYFNKPTGGLKAIHITNDYTDMDGALLANQNYTGTLYISDTSIDTMYHDDAILMFAIPESNYSTYQNMELTVTASGYQWEPTGDGLKPSNPGSYQPNFYSESFDISNFLANTSEWRPAGLDDYPVYYGQDMSADEEFKFMFIDLNLGTLNDTTLTNYGAVKVDYTISNFAGNAIFDAYAFNNQSAQGQGVSWTNKGSSSGSSGWTINF